MHLCQCAVSTLSVASGIAYLTVCLKYCLQSKMNSSENGSVSTTPYSCMPATMAMWRL